jgi:peptide/nickel transport system substrate-binding protein
MQIDNQGVPMVLWFNLLREPFSDTQFRQAISYCIDYDELLNIIGGGYGNRSNAGFAPRSHTATLKQENNTGPTKANAMLDTLGYVDVNHDGYREKPDGSKFQPDWKHGQLPYPQAAQLI